MDERSRIEQALAEALADHPEGELIRAARYATLGGGHRWRGRLALRAGGLFRADAEDVALPLAAAVEMMHAASLVLDDLPSMDNAATRRGKACVHLVFPEWTVDLLPAFLVNRAYRAVADAEAAPAECRVRALRLLGELGGDLAAGQEMDLALARKKASGTELLDCYARKSGSLFAAALACAAQAPPPPPRCARPACAWARPINCSTTSPTGRKRTAPTGRPGATPPIRCSVPSARANARKRCWRKPRASLIDLVPRPTACAGCWLSCAAAELRRRRRARGVCPTRAPVPVRRA